VPHPALWRAGELAREVETTPSGFEALDRHLPGRGWPQAGLCEFMLPTAGVGELRLLLPALRELSRQARWIAWVNPPFIPYAPALRSAGVDIDKILLIHPKNHKDALWALERATRSGTCSAALAWLDEQQLKAGDTRRLQLAARQGNTLSCLFRPDRAREENSMAELRLAIQPAAGEDALSVSICKRRGGWPVPDLQVPLGTSRRPAEIKEQLTLWRQWRSAELPRQTDRIGPFPMPSPEPGDADRRVTH
jgi:cell division inhibitor SulA/protein ImuA